MQTETNDNDDLVTRLRKVLNINSNNNDFSKNDDWYIPSERINQVINPGDEIYF